MTNQEDYQLRFLPSFSWPKFLILGCSLLLFVLSFFLWRDHHPPLLASPFGKCLLLVIAALALWLSKEWSYLVAAVFSGLVAYLIGGYWLGDSYASDMSLADGTWSFSKMVEWWQALASEYTINGYMADFLPLGLGLIIFFYAAVCFARAIFPKQSVVP